MILHRWNYNTHKYDNVEVPDDLHYSTYEMDSDTIINCACCKQPIKCGETYTSLEWHDDVGFGYCVCETCYEHEWELRKKYRNE